MPRIVMTPNNYQQKSLLVSKFYIIKKGYKKSWTYFYDGRGSLPVLIYINTNMKNSLITFHKNLQI